MSTQTGTALATLPRVNLLPPEIQEQARLRKVQAGLGLAVAAALGAAGLLYLAASNSANDAQQQLDASNARAATLKSRMAAYSEVPAVIAAVEAARTQVSQAMGQEVRWSYFLNDLSLTVPDRVWLTDMTVTQNVDAASAVPAATAPGAGGYLTPGIGSVSFTGKAYGHKDVAAWLDSLAKQQGYTQPYFTDSTVEPVGDRETAVKFTSQVTLTTDALSGRWTQKAGS